MSRTDRMTPIFIRTAENKGLITIFLEFNHGIKTNNLLKYTYPRASFRHLGRIRIEIYYPRLLRVW
jgi:hypothetical protein